MSEKSSSGCLKAILITLGILLVLVVGGAYYVYSNIGKLADLALDKGVDVVESGLETMLRDLEYPEAEITRAMVPVKSFSLKIKKKEVSLEQGLGVLQSLFEGPMFSAVILQSFEKQFVQTSTDLSAEEKEEAKLSISRYLHGMSEEKIPYSKTEEILAVIQEETTDENGETTKKTKEHLTTDEVRQCLSLVKEAADQANIEVREFSLDLAEQFEKAIQKGMEEGLKVEEESQ